MGTYNKNARAVLNSFLWNNLISSGILDEDQYRPDEFTKSIVPIVPSQEVPEINDLLPDKEFIVYDYEVLGYYDEWWICEEVMMYSIIGSSVSKVVEISEFMIDLFRRVDSSGHDVQLFNPENQLMSFYSVKISGVSGPTPIEMEGGRTTVTVEITYKYARILDSDGRFL